MNMHMIFHIGDEIGNYCDGFFGEDYEDKTCVYVSTKYAVFQYSNGQATVLNYTQGLERVVDESWIQS